MTRHEKRQPTETGSTNGAAFERKPPLSPRPDERTQTPPANDTGSTKVRTKKRPSTPPPSQRRRGDATPEPSKERDPARAAARAAMENKGAGNARNVQETETPVGEDGRKHKLRETLRTPTDTGEPNPSNTRRRRGKSPSEASVKSDVTGADRKDKGGGKGGVGSKLKSWWKGSDDPEEDRNVDEQPKGKDSKAQRDKEREVPSPDPQRSARRRSNGATAKDSRDPRKDPDLHRGRPEATGQREIDPERNTGRGHGRHEGREQDVRDNGPRSGPARHDRDAVPGSTRRADEDNMSWKERRRRGNNEREEREDSRHPPHPREPFPEHLPDEHPYDPLRYFSDQELNSGMKCKGCGQHKPQCGHCFQILPKRQVLSRVRRQDVNELEEDIDEGSDCEGCGQPIPLCKLCGLPLPKEQVLERSKAQAKAQTRSHKA